MCKISIIVPLYNGEKTIERCLESLCKQTMKDLEILVVNDGSTDNGPEIVQNLMKRDCRIKLISQKNQGLGAARNHGIREAAGKYVGFVDCDDFADKDMFRIMTDALENSQTLVAVCQEKNVYVEKDEIQFISETRFPVEKETVYSSSDILKWMLNYTYMSLNSMCYKVVKRSVFIENHIEVPEKYRHAEDLVTSSGIFSYVDQVVVVPQSLYYYVHNKGSLSYSYSLRHAEDIYLDWLEVQEYVKVSKKELYMDNFALGMYFTSLKQLSWATNKEEKNCEDAKQLKKKWKNARQIYKWKPCFLGVEVPLLHRIKVYVAYFHVCHPIFAVIKRLKWIPLFKYMT